MSGVEMEMEAIAEIEQSLKQGVEGLIDSINSLFSSTSEQLAEVASGRRGAEFADAVTEVSQQTRSGLSGGTEEMGALFNQYLEQLAEASGA